MFISIAKILQQFLASQKEDVLDRRQKLLRLSQD